MPTGNTKDLILSGRKARGVADATQLAAPATKEQQTTPVAAPQKAETPKTFGGVKNDKGEVVGQQNVPELKVDGTLNDTQLKKWQALNAPNPNEDETEKTLRDYMNSINATSAKEEEAERKKARSRAIIGGVSDMAVAVSNIINANKGGVSMPQSNLAGMYAGKWAERKKEIQGLRDKKFQAGMNIATLKDKRKAQKAQNELAKQQLGIDMAKLQIEITKAQQEGDLKKAQALKAQYDAILAGVKAKNEELYGAKEKESIINRNKASAASSYASANKTNQEANKAKSEQMTEIPMGDGTTVAIATNRLNDATVSYLFNQLPEYVRSKYGQTITTDLVGNKIVTRNPGKQQMLNAIGEMMASDGTSYTEGNPYLPKMLQKPDEEKQAMLQDFAAKKASLQEALRGLAGPTLAWGMTEQNKNTQGTGKWLKQ